VIVGWMLMRLGFGPIQLAEAVKGRARWMTLQIISWPATVVSIVVVLLILGSTASTMSQMVAASRADRSWKGVGGAVTLRFGSTTTAADFDSLADRFAALYRHFENDRKVVLAKPPTVREFRPRDHGPFSGNSLVVNPEYLDRNVVLDMQGHPVESATVDPGQLTLLIPAPQWNERKRILADFREWADFQLSGQSQNTEAGIHAIQVQAAQEVFNYGANSFAFGSTQRGAVVAVLGGESDIVASDFYVTAASNGALVFDDADELRAALVEFDLASHVASVDSAAGLALNKQADRFGVLIALSLNALIAIFAMLLTTGALTWSHLERTRPIWSARMMLGHSFFERHSAFLVVQAMSGAVALLLCAASGAIAGLAVFIAAVLVLALHGGAFGGLLWCGERAFAATARTPSRSRAQVRSSHD